MRKSYLALFFLIACFLVLQAQQRPPIVVDQVQIPFQVNSSSTALLFQWTETEIKYGLADFYSIRISDILLEETDMKVRFSLREAADDLQFYVGAYVTRMKNGERPWFSSPKDVRLEKRSETGDFIMTWKNFGQDRVEMNRQYQLNLEVRIYSNLCDVAPTFALKEKLPHYTAAIAGLSILGAGQIFRRQQNRELDRYNESWRDGEFVDLEEVDKNFQRFRNLTYLGIGVLALDGLWYYIRAKKHKKKLARYQDYCSKRSIVQPIINPEKNIGLLLKIDF